MVMATATKTYFVSLIRYFGSCGGEREDVYVWIVRIESTDSLFRGQVQTLFNV